MSYTAPANLLSEGDTLLIHSGRRVRATEATVKSRPIIVAGVVRVTTTRGQLDIPVGATVDLVRPLRNDPRA